MSKSAEKLDWFNLASASPSCSGLKFTCEDLSFEA
jgi:hypothetical protein